MLKKKHHLLFAIFALVLSACLCTLPIPVTPTVQPSPPIVTPTLTPVPPSPTSLDPTIGAAGLGDPYYPLMGNGGYDALHYDITLDVDMAKDTVIGSTVLDAQAIQDLSAFNLDFSGLTVRQVMVDSAPAEFSRNGSELTIIPDAMLTSGSRFEVRVDYDGIPKELSDPSLAVGDGVGWLTFQSGVYTINEPSGSMGWFPSNNHPTDKATYTFRVTVAKPYVAAANGLLTETVDNGNSTTYVWEEGKPMASYLASVNIAKFNLRTATGPNGLPMRSYFESSLTEADIQAYDHLPEMIAFYSNLIAPYPFEAYGVVVIPESVGVAMENQTLSVFGADMGFEDAIAHELAHQWFGDSVTMSNWRDIWLNEGFASYMEWLWIEHTQGKEAYRSQINDMYAYAQVFFPPGNPSPSSLFDGSVYIRGGLVLHALRVTVGDETFFDILQTYYQRYQYSNASSEDFIALAEEVSGQDLGPFFDAWLYGSHMPPMP
jgi:aminopeptidase N